MTIVDLFAGPGGWSEGLAMLGLTDTGIEWDRDACLTRRAAGHLTVQADVATYPPEAFTGATGLIASPPCPDFSAAGSGLGRAGKSGWLVDVPRRWVETLRPEWVACEQVPGALPIWREHAHAYRELGYSTWCGILNSAGFGVPQTRKRAILLASQVGQVGPPAPTHAQDPKADLFGPGLKPWVTMADALGYAPAPWCLGRPATTLCGDPRVSPPGWRGRPDDYAPDGTYMGKRSGTDAIRLTIDEATVLQSFRPGYPWQGSRTSTFTQVGNAVPPLLAGHVLSAVTGVPMRALAVAS